MMTPDFQCFSVVSLCCWYMVEKEPYMFLNNDFRKNIITHHPSTLSQISVRNVFLQQPQEKGCKPSHCISHLVTSLSKSSSVPPWFQHTPIWQIKMYCRLPMIGKNCTCVLRGVPPSWKYECIIYLLHHILSNINIYKKINCVWGCEIRNAENSQGKEQTKTTINSILICNTAC